MLLFKFIRHRPNKFFIILGFSLILLVLSLKSSSQPDMNKIFKHITCRNAMYAGKINRFSVPDDLIPWSVKFDEYKPPHFELPMLREVSWADPPIDDPNFKPKFNEQDGNVIRKSHIGVYEVRNNLPLNPFGRTGLTGRGCLGRFGPNHAADPVVSTWKRDENNEIVKHAISQKPILRILCIKRGDTGDIAIPGGMVEAGEQVSTTLKREFIEEALNGKMEESELDEFFGNGEEIFKGYVDDPRNTDNAWIETVAVNFHDESGEFLNKLKFEAGDDAVGIHWIEVDQSVKLYASHSKLVQGAAELRKAHF